MQARRGLRLSSPGLAISNEGRAAARPSSRLIPIAPRLGRAAFPVARPFALYALRSRHYDRECRENITDHGAVMLLQPVAAVTSATTRKVNRTNAIGYVNAIRYVNESR